MLFYYVARLHNCGLHETSQTGARELKTACRNLVRDLMLKRSPIDLSHDCVKEVKHNNSGPANSSTLERPKTGPKAPTAAERRP